MTPEIPPELTHEAVEWLRALRYMLTGWRLAVAVGLVLVLWLGPRWRRKP